MDYDEQYKSNIPRQTECQVFEHWISKKEITMCFEYQISRTANSLTSASCFRESTPKLLLLPDTTFHIISDL